MQQDHNFASVIRRRRRELDLTQEEVARRIGTSTSYIAHLESARRHPSEEVVVQLAEVLMLDARELFFLANPQTRDLISCAAEQDTTSVWEAFAQNEKLHRTHKITGQELETLSRVALMGEVRSPADFIFILQAIRNVLGR
jgi:transcriptional regulator with XRE-family HTH domain